MKGRLVQLDGIQNPDIGRKLHSCWPRSLLLVLLGSPLRSASFATDFEAQCPPRRGELKGSRLKKPKHFKPLKSRNPSLSCRHVPEFQALEKFMGNSQAKTWLVQNSNIKK
jgi:hypothetical protein